MVTLVAHDNKRKMTMSILNSKLASFLVTGSWNALEGGRLSQFSVNRVIEFSTTSGQNLYYCRCIPSVAAAQLLRAGAFLWPSICSVCGEPLAEESHEYVQFHQRFSDRFLHLRTLNKSPRCAKHCEHSFPGIAARLHIYSPVHMSVSILGLSKTVVSRLSLDMTRGVVAAPWAIAPRAIPDLRWGILNNDDWFHNVWRSYWNSLKHDERSRYLIEWRASKEWREYLQENM